VRAYAALRGIQDLYTDEFSLSTIVHDDAGFIFDAFLDLTRLSNNGVQNIEWYAASVSIYSGYSDISDFNC